MKLLVICPGSDTDVDSIFYLIDPDTGECLNHHLCSCAYYAQGDLFYNHPNIIEVLQLKYNEEVYLKFIDETGYTEKELLKKNRDFYEN